MKKITLALMVLIVSALAYSADGKSASFRGGKLSITGDTNDMQLLFKGKLLRVGDGFSLSIEKTFSTADTDIALVMNNSGGTACPVQYFFVSVSSNGVAKMSPEFGTCSDLAKPVQKGAVIIVTMPKMRGKGSAKYVFENGVVKEGSRPIK